MVSAGRSLFLAVSVLAGAAACRPTRANDATAKHLQPESAWIVDPKLDPDTQELLLRAYDEALAFPFRVRTADGRESILDRRPGEVAALVADASVTSIACAPPPAADPTDDGWRDRVDPEVRTIYAARSACYTPVVLGFSRDVAGEEKSELESLGAVLKAFDARTAIGWLPVRAVPAVATLAFVERVQRD